MKIFKFSEDIEISPAIYEFWYKMLMRCHDEGVFYLLPPFIDFYYEDDEEDEVELENPNK